MKAVFAALLGLLLFAPASRAEDAAEFCANFKRIVVECGFDKKQVERDKCDASVKAEWVSRWAAFKDKNLAKREEILKKANEYDAKASQATREGNKEASISHRETAAMMRSSISVWQCAIPLLEPYMKP